MSGGQYITANKNSIQTFDSDWYAAVKDDKKPLFLREFANWQEDWQSLQRKKTLKNLL